LVPRTVEDQSKVRQDRQKVEPQAYKEHAPALSILGRFESHLRESGGLFRLDRAASVPSSYTVVHDRARDLRPACSSECEVRFETPPAEQTTEPGPVAHRLV
jgi:hypothetical protein